MRYYRWALEQWRWEVEQNLPTLRSFTDPGASFALRAFEELPRQDQLKVGRALVRNYNKEALEFLGEQFTAADQHLAKAHFQRTSAAFDSWLWRRARAVAPRNPWSQKVPAYRPGKPVAALRKEVRKMVEPILGSELLQVEPRHWNYRNQIGRWAILTDIYFRTSHDLAYSHDIRFGTESEVMCRSITALHWLGVSSEGMAGWTLSSPDEIPAAAAALATVCRQFIEAAPALLPE